ncbi:BMC domain-containing protein [Oscillospiraceae bacterium PP1C4]
MAAKLAMGFLECAGYGVALYAMDKACKVAQIHILGVDTINPKDTSAHIPMTTQVKFEGGVSDVKIAAETARQAALRFNSEQEVLCSVIENPYDGIEKLGRITKVPLSPLE